ncbi:putative DNA primase/helicase [Methylobacterium sp. UNC300MFChir4.1]|uniref:phage/plasmid primase, P4 family n=1 Tax=Methylobacterium sp. UNC300MFChir4.1 TaxID=1502747 RepID=UPI0008BFC3DF|nr:phage/plasmid primase, P4 family [Methylobacterium sp. UNC300MFChir4.1]SEP22471.1 putative DNA primase/helicase [Methylobacterium sp. UNC300MFChir4.1]
MNMLSQEAFDNVDIPEFDVASVRKHALRYGLAGLRVIPIPLGMKGPRVKDWQRKASSNADTISDFFPEGYRQNIGIVLGDGLVAFDVDDLEELDRLIAKHGQMPRTPTQRTGSGKLHYLFRVSGGVKLKNRTGFLPGLDLKSDSGQIVVEPSVHPNGNTYQWLPGLAPGDLEIAEMPGWLLDILLKPEPKPPGGGKGCVKEGGRNVALTREAGRLRARGAEEDEVRTALIARNSTFLPPLDLSEVNTVVASAMKWEPGVLRYIANDHGLATRFVDELGDDLRFVADENQWLIWNGNIWERDETGRIVQLFLEMAQAMLAEAEAIRAAEDDKKATKAKEKALGWAKQAGENKRINSALKVAQTDPRIVVTLAQLDNFPGYLPVANGIVELSSGELLPTAKEKLATHASPYAYTAGKACPSWKAVIARALPGELSPFFQRVLGYSLMGNPCEQRFFMLRGEGADSKSTVARVMSGLLGSLLIRPAGETFLAGDAEITSNAPRADLMAFRGARVVFAPEPDSRRKLDKELIKRLTGQDGIQARAPYGRAMVEFEMTGVVLMLANHLPACDEADEAVWRRLTLIPFDNTVPEVERDVMLVEKLLANEAEGILAWLIEGAQAYSRDGLQVPELVRQRTADWRRSAGRIERFVDENCVREGSALLKDLHQAYQWTCRHEQIHPLGLDKFSARLKQLGFTIEVAQAGETVIGLRSRY